ncbi:MAG: ArsR family transcriptional regulator [Nitrospirota bacterium]
MRVKNIKISLKSDKELFEEIKKITGKLESGEKVKKHGGISFDNLETMRKILTDARIKILKTIKKDNPGSIYELAKMLHRDTKNTFDDVKFLSEMGLIELRKTKNGREKTTPMVKYDKILLEIAV